MCVSTRIQNMKLIFAWEKILRKADTPVKNTKYQLEQCAYRIFTIVWDFLDITSTFVRSSAKTIHSWRFPIKNNLICIARICFCRYTMCGVDFRMREIFAEGRHSCEKSEIQVVPYSGFSLKFLDIAPTFVKSSAKTI